MRGLPAVLVEAFTDEPLGGNGAGVVLLEHPAPAVWMQRLAGRLLQSETAFLLPRRQGWALRWFTPCQEVPLCGHATLASILALRHWQRLPADGMTTFHTRSGPLAVAHCPGAGGGLPQGQLELPRQLLEPADPPSPLLALLQSRMEEAPLGFWHSSLGYGVALLPPSAPLKVLASVADALSGETRQGLVLMQALPWGSDTATVAGEKADYQLRFFAPGLGIDEDAVTGSAHALVAPYWMETLQRSRVVGWQCSDRPGGMVCEAGSSGMIRLTGSGHLLWEGTLWIGPEVCSASSDPSTDPSMEWLQACGP